MARHWSCNPIVLIVLAGWLGAAQGVAAAPIVEGHMEWKPDTCLPVDVNNVTLRLEVATDSSETLNLNPDAAVKAGLRPRGLERFIFATERLEAIDRSIEISGHVRTLPVRIAGQALQRAPVIWHQQTRISASCDGFVSIWLFAAPRITLLQPAAPPPTREASLELASDGQWIPDYAGRVELDGDSLRAAIDLTVPDTVVNAAAAQLLERNDRLRRSGVIALHAVRYGLTRAAERAELVGYSPLGLRLPEVFVHGERRTEPATTSAPPEGVAPGEVAPVTVQGRRSKPLDPPALTLGYKAVANCRSLTFDRTTHTVTLACAD